jgi:hypothetical protein
VSEPVLRSNRPYWVLRGAETVLLLTSLVGMGLFAWSLVDIIRIETDPSVAGSNPPLAWPGVFIFLGSMVALQLVRMLLQRYRRDDGAPRGDERAAAAVTAELLADLTSAGDDVAGVRDDPMDA